ncbi:MAG: hypothetical protein COA42_03545, partial [Alteromonadaceae bacterium]
MAKPENSNSNQVSDSLDGRVPVGTVTGVQGNVVIIDIDGRVLEVQAGHPIYQGQTLKSHENSAVVATMIGAGTVSLGHDESLLFDKSLLDAINGVLEGGLGEGVNLELFAEQIESGLTVDELLEATAAGGVGDESVTDTGSGNVNPARLSLSGEEVTPDSNFDTVGLNRGTAEVNELGLGELNAEFLATANNTAPLVTPVLDITVDQGEAFFLDLSTVFSDVDVGQILSFDVEGLPDGLVFDAINGTINGELTNDAAFDQNGDFLVTLTATDDSGGTNSTVQTSFNLFVNDVNDAPLAGPEVTLNDINEDGTITFDTATLLAGASDIDLNDELSVTQLDLGNAQGSIQDNGDGTFTFTPDADWNGSVAVSFVVDDGRGGQVTNIANFTVNPTNDAPVAQADDGISTDVRQSVNFDVLSNDTDPDGDTLTIISADAGNGVVVINPDGQLTYTPNDDFAGPTDTVNYTITDPSGVQSSASATIVVNYTPGAVSLDLPESFDASQPAFSGTSTGIVGDISLTVNGVEYTVSPDQNGNWSFDLPAEAALADGNYSVSVAATDALDIAAADNGSFAIDAVTPAVTITQTTVGDDGLVSFSGDSSNIEGDLILTIGDAGRVVTPNPDGSWQFDWPVVLDDGSYQIVVTGTDSGGEAAVPASNDFVVDTSVDPINKAPVANDDNAITTDEDVAVNNIDVLSNDTDAENETLNVIGASAENGTVTINSDGTLNYTPNADFNGSDTITYAISDGNGGTSSATIALTVNPVDDLPVVSSDNGTVTENSAPNAAGVLTANDVDNPALAFVAETIAGSFGSLNVDSAGNWAYTLNANAEALDQDQVVNDGITINLNDGSTTTVTLNVTGTEDAPVVSGSFVDVTTEGNVGDPAATATGTLSISDVDGDDSPAFNDQAATTGNNALGSFVLTGGTWTYTLDQNAVQDLDAGDTATDTITYTATDGTAQQIIVTINGSDDASVVAGSFTDSVAEGNVGDPAATATGTLFINDVDGDDSPAFNDQASTAGDNALGSFVLTGGAWTFTLDQSAVQNLDAGDVVTDT